MLASCCDAPSGSPWLPLQMEIRLTPSARRSANKDKEPHERLRRPWADRSSNAVTGVTGTMILQRPSRANLAARETVEEPRRASPCRRSGTGMSPPGTRWPISPRRKTGSGISPAAPGRPSIDFHLREGAANAPRRLAELEGVGRRAQLDVPLET